VSAKKVLNGLLATVVVMCAVSWIARAAPGAEAAVTVPAPTLDNPRQPGALQTAVLAGGCFWGVQGVFEHVHGVRKVLAGYSGGSALSAHYQDVGTGTSGHAESVQISFDPAEVSYGQLLQVYFSVAHDPTQLNRQGPDSGSQYRSSIFYADDTQRHIAESYIAQLSEAKAFARPIVTKVDALKGFYAAEGYHQDFLIKNPSYPYIVYNDLPKIRNLKAEFPQLYQDAPAMVSAAR
jgi:peptide-methionine (S)-S-oxide reductase